MHYNLYIYIIPENTNANVYRCRIGPTPRTPNGPTSPRTATSTTTAVKPRSWRTPWRRGPGTRSTQSRHVALAPQHHWAHRAVGCHKGLRWGDLPQQVGKGWGRGLGLVDFFWMNCHESWWCSPQKCEMWIMWVMIMIGNFDKCDVFVSPNLPRCMRIPQPCSHGVGYVIFGIHMERHETQTLFHGQYKWLFKSLHYI
jgi:hypothetical protein